MERAARGATDGPSFVQLRDDLAIICGQVAKTFAHQWVGIRTSGGNAVRRVVCPVEGADASGPWWHRKQTGDSEYIHMLSTEMISSRQFRVRHPA